MQIKGPALAPTMTLAFVAVIFVIGVVLLGVAVPTGPAHDMVIAAYSFATALVKDAWSYFFGTTRGSETKTNMLSVAGQSAPVAPAEPPVAVVEAPVAPAEAPLRTLSDPVAPPAAPVSVQPGAASMAWGKHVTPGFRNGVWWICDQMGWDRQEGGDNLMACMAWESGETFDPAVKNMAGSGATGLIQFMPKTAEKLSTTTDALAAMTPVQQLSYVYKYLRQFRKLRGPGVTLADMYMSILMPAYIGEPMDSVLFSGGIAFRQNSGLDSNHDGKVTKLEAAAKVYAKLERGRLPQHRWTA